MEGPVVTLVGGNYTLGLWLFDTKDYQITIMKYKDGEMVYHDTLYPKCNSEDDLLYYAIDWFKERNLLWKIAD